MKRNDLALLLVIIMMVGCILVSAPSVFAEEAGTTTEEATEEATEAPTEEATEAPTEEATEAPTEEATEAPTEEATEEATEALDDTDLKAAKSPIREPIKTILVYIIKFFKAIFAYLGI